MPLLRPRLPAASQAIKVAERGLVNDPDHPELTSLLHKAEVQQLAERAFAAEERLHLADERLVEVEDRLARTQEKLRAQTDAAELAAAAQAAATDRALTAEAEASRLRAELAAVQPLPAGASAPASALLPLPGPQPLFPRCPNRAALLLPPIFDRASHPSQGVASGD